MNLSVTDFRKKCLQLIEDLPASGIVITKHGKPVAKVVAMSASCSTLIGTIKNLAPDDDDDLFSTGVPWDAESRHSHPD
jgi:antitoxin (DNA-binding transcriptional repressor) of toxin-antitoxin stability system